MWFWPRPDIPASITQATPTGTMDLTDWGMPSAAYPAAGCNITEFFPAQELVVGALLFAIFFLSGFCVVCVDEGRRSASVGVDNLRSVVLSMDERRSALPRR
jgi:hypothetical protein